jgi:hypothetical protein
MKVGFVSVSMIILAGVGGALVWSHAKPSKPPRAVHAAAVSEPEQEPAPIAAPSHELAIRPSPRLPARAPVRAEAPRPTDRRPTMQTHSSSFDGLSATDAPIHAQNLFDAEPPSAWGHEARNTLTNKLDQVKVPGANVDSIECRSSTCKVTADFQDLDAKDAYYAKAYIGHDAAVTPLKMTIYAHVIDSPDGLKSEAYLYRDGIP